MRIQLGLSAGDTRVGQLDLVFGDNSDEHGKPLTTHPVDTVLSVFGPFDSATASFECATRAKGKPCSRQERWFREKVDQDRLSKSRNLVTVGSQRAEFFQQRRVGKGPGLPPGQQSAKPIVPRTPMEMTNCLRSNFLGIAFVCGALPATRRFAVGAKLGNTRI